MVSPTASLVNVGLDYLQDSSTLHAAITNPFTNVYMLR